MADASRHKKCMFDDIVVTVFTQLIGLHLDTVTVARHLLTAIASSVGSERVFLSFDLVNLKLCNVESRKLLFSNRQSKNVIRLILVTLPDKSHLYFIDHAI